MYTLYVTISKLQHYKVGSHCHKSLTFEETIWKGLNILGTLLIFLVCIFIVQFTGYFLLYLYGHNVSLALRRDKTEQNKTKCLQFAKHTQF